jgi:WD40-like Beta Propeller Repeat
MSSSRAGECPGGSRRLSRSVVVVALCAVFGALAATSAFAAKAHVLEGTAGGPGTGPGQFALVESDGIAPASSVAVDNSAGSSTGDFYVTDTANQRVEKFEAGGTFLLGFGADVGGSGIDVCTLICGPGTAGTAPGQFEAPALIAVDSSAGPSAGDVYVADSAADLIQKFTPTGALITSWGAGGQLDGSTATDGPFGPIDGIAVGAGGDLYVLGESATIFRFEDDGSFVEDFPSQFANAPVGLAVDTSGNFYKARGSGVVAKLASDGSGLIGEFAPSPVGGLFVDLPTEDVYLTYPNQISIYESSGSPLELAIGAGEGLSGLGGLGVAATDKTIYVADAPANRIDIFPFLNVPVATATSATGLAETAATVQGEVNPEGFAVTSCRFEYVTEAAFQTSGFLNLSSGGSAPCSEPSAAEIGAGAAPVPVKAALSGLAPNTTYRFRLTAATEGGAHSAAAGFTTLSKPTIDSTSVSAVSAAGATLEAELNPHGFATTYHFEYDTVEYTEGGGPHGTPVPAGSAGEGKADVRRAAQIQGLAPSTTYFFRIVAVNSLGEVRGPQRSFTTTSALVSSLLPDGRGWDLVSPPDKHGSSLEAITLEGGQIQAAEDGQALAYIAKAPVDPDPAGNRSFAEQQLLASRGSGGWSTADVATPHEAVAGLNSGELSEYQLFAPNLSRALVEPAGATPLSPAAGERTPYLREPDGSYVPLVNPGNVAPGVKYGAEEEEGHLFASSGVQIAVATPDLSHVVLRSEASLVEGFDAGELGAFYEWVGGRLTPISILPGGASAATAGGVATLSEAAGGGLLSQVSRHAISADGERVFFQTTVAGNLYVRQVGAGQTAQLDAPEAGAAGGELPATYQDASTEGAAAFFTDAARLTTDSTAAEEKRDLYRCDVAALVGEASCAAQGALSDMTIGAGGEAADVLGSVLGAAGDGSSVYFVANGVLANAGVPVPGAVQGNCFQQLVGQTEAELRARSCNLYHWHDGQVSLVAVLSNVDFPDWSGKSPVDLAEMTARVSPDGRYLAFMSQRPLTGYDNRDLRSGARDEEVFLYDSLSGRVLCASCNPTGARPVGSEQPDYGMAQPRLIDRAEIWSSGWLAGSIPGWTSDKGKHSLYQSNYLNDQGRLFFNSLDPLVPADVNGTTDVYEYEPPAVGDCSTASAGFAPRAEGCLGLISSGTSSEESVFLDASRSGDDAFFLTAARLSAADTDGALDVYDAHVCTGSLPCLQPAPAPPQACSGEECQPPSAPSDRPTPATTIFSGPGNVQGCPKGKVRQKGKCVKLKQAKKKNGKKNKSQNSKKKKGKKHTKKRTNSKHGGHK